MKTIRERIKEIELEMRTAERLIEAYACKMILIELKKWADIYEPVTKTEY